MLRKRAKHAAKQLSQLPVLRHSERSLNELRIRKSTSINHVIRVVERDPALALELFVAANRDLKHAGKPPATNIRRALLVFGLTRYLEHSKSYETLENHLPPSFLRPIMNHLGRSYFAAKLSERLAAMRGQVYAEDAFCFGLMCDLDRYAGKLIAAANVTADILNLRTLLPGLATPMIAGDPLHWCADNASKFALTTQYAWNQSSFANIVKNIADTVDADVYDVESELTKTALLAALDSKHFNEFPAARNLMNPGPLEPHTALLFPDERRARIAPTLTRAKTTQRASIRKASAHGSEKPARKNFLLDEKDLLALDTTISKAGQDIDVLGSTKPTRTRILPFALQVMTTVLKANKTLFIANPGDGRLVVRLQAGRNTKPKSINLALQPDDNIVLRKGVASGRPLHINPQKIKEHDELFDAKLSALLGENDVYSIPLKTKKKVIGILLMRFDPNTTNNWPMHFKLCKRLAESIVHALSATNA